MEIRDAILLVVLGMALGGLAVWLVMAQHLRAARQDSAEQAARLRKLAHDVRGAVTSGLLMTERLESNTDASVRLAATVIAQAMDRAADLAKAASAETRGVAPAPPGNV
jgi:signal transduction histidine kinase